MDIQTEALVLNKLLQYTNGYGYTDLHNACQNRDMDVVEYLNDNEMFDFDIKARNCAGDMPLHIAAQWGHIEVVRYLWAKGADVNEKNIFGDTPLHMAARYGYLDVVKYLLSVGADVAPINDSNETPLQSALQYGNVDIVRHLKNL